MTLLSQSCMAIRQFVAVLAASGGLIALTSCGDPAPGTPEEAYFNFEYALLCTAKKESDVVSSKYLKDDKRTFDTVRSDLKERLANNEDYVPGCLFLTFGNRGLKAREVAPGKYYIDEEVGGKYLRVPGYYVVNYNGKLKIAAGD